MSAARGGHEAHLDEAFPGPNYFNKNKPVTNTTIPPVTPLLPLEVAKHLF